MHHADKIVCFDIGGVLVRIRHTWDQAVAAISESPKSSHEVPLNSFSGLLRYQESTLQEEVYLQELGIWLGLEPEKAARVHQAILDSDYPGAAAFVDELKAQGIYTCCFSNTNALHWRYLTDPEYHPAVAALDQKIASHELNAAKPDEASFKKVDDLLPPHERVIFFDDTNENVIAARKFGWTSFLIDPKGNPVLQMRETLARLEVFG